MKNKRTLLILLGIVLAVALIGILCIGLRVAPTVNHALRISELLQPVVNAQNQTLHIAASVGIGEKTVNVESDIFLVTEEDRDFLVLEQNGNAIFVSGNVLYLENGKAFKIGDEMQVQLTAYEDLIPQIGALYDTLAITAAETENETVYSITVTGEQMETLLAAASLGDALPVEGIRQLHLQLTEKNGKLEQIRFSGDGTFDQTAITLDVVMSGFRILAAGDYPIPGEVKHSAATVDPDSLFSLTEDLYRLVLALIPLTEAETLGGTLELTVDCGPIQLDTQLQLSELQTSAGSVDPEKLQALPEMLGWLCMEGDIRCAPENNGYVYTLALDQQSMQELAGMILPELQQYGGSLTEGSVTILLENGEIRSMNVSITGKINALITKIPVEIGAGFSF